MDAGDLFLTGPLALARSTVDRSTQLRTDAARLAAAWNAPSTRVLVVGNNEVAVTDGGRRLKLVGTDAAPPGQRYLLGVDDGVAYFAVHVSGTPAAGATLRQVGAIFGDRDAGLAVHAVSLANWHEHNRHCSRCGALTEVICGGHVRRCPADGSEHYPRTDPAVIVLVVDPQERCLLGRSAAWPVGRFSTLAGFVEPGETPEQAIVREVMEEAGIVVTSSRYAGSQPWPFPSSLMLGYYATADAAAAHPDGAELAEARWFTRAELERAVDSGELTLPGDVSIARRLIEGWFGRRLAQCQ